MRGKLGDEYKPGSRKEMVEYPCGVAAGDELVLVRDLSIEDSEGLETGDACRAGEVWTVLVGSFAEPNVVWLRQANGELHTWDGDEIFQTFSRRE